MSYISLIKYSIYLVLVSLLTACGGAASDEAEVELGGPSAVLSPPDNTYSTVKLRFSDTSSPRARAIINGLDSFYRIQVRNGFNGSVLVGYQGKVLYERYFGVCNREAELELCPESPTQLASTSKPFTATAILWLHQNKYLDIRDKVSKYISGFPYNDITVKMLLTHRSGIPDYLKFAEKYWPRSKNMTNDELMDVFRKHKPGLLFTPGRRFDYSNSNYAILASILEEVTQMRYPQFLKEFIFEPLGMKNSFVYDPLGYKPEKMAISYKSNWTREPDTYADGIYGDKGIFSTVKDLYRWDQSFYKNVLLSDQTLEMAYDGYSPDMPGVRDYGMGWRMLDFPDGYKVVYHNGWWHGNNTVFYRYIQDNFTIIVLGNRYNRRIYSQAKAIYNIVQSRSELPPTSRHWEDD